MVAKGFYEQIRLGYHSEKGGVFLGGSVFSIGGEN